MSNNEKSLLYRQQDLEQFLTDYAAVVLHKCAGTNMEHVSKMYPSIRREMEEKGANPDTLDNFENYVKKVSAGVIEHRKEKFKELIEILALEIIKWIEKKALKEGRKLIIELTEED